MDRPKENNSYRDMLKNSSLFGGVKVMQLLINIVRGKFVAMFLGPAGMGISSLFNTSAQSIQKIASLGLNTAIVKEISASRSEEELRDILAASNALIYATALLGAVICMACAPWLSELSFGTRERTWGFVLLGVMIFFTIAGSGQTSMLQGLRRVKMLARASITGAVTGLVVGVPLYYFMGDRGIVPAMIALALAIFICNTLSLRRALGRDAARFVWEAHRPVAKRLLRLGMLMMASEVAMTIITYAINAYIRHTGGLDDVGFYQAANSITLQYTEVVFSALMLDYLPRLSSVAADDGRMRTVVNRQMEIVSYLIGPMVCGLILFGPVVIRVLLTSSFLEITPLVRWMSLGMVLKALMAPLGLISFAKDNARLYLWLEGIGGPLMTLALSCIMYRLFGLVGLGYALVADCGLCLAVYYIVNRLLYSYRLNPAVWRAVLFASVPACSTFAASYIPDALTAYTVMGVLTAATCITALYRLKSLWHRQ